MIDNTFQVLSKGKVKRISEDTYLKALYNKKRKGWIIGYIGKGQVLFHHNGQSIYMKTKQMQAVLDLLNVPDPSKGEKP